jgi:hypothetical protein
MWDGWIMRMEIRFPVAENPRAVNNIHNRHWRIKFVCNRTYAAGLAENGLICELVATSEPPFGIRC